MDCSMGRGGRLIWTEGEVTPTETSSAEVVGVGPHGALKIDHNIIIHQQLLRNERTKRKR